MAIMKDILGYQPSRESIDLLCDSLGELAKSGDYAKKIIIDENISTHKTSFGESLNFSKLIPPDSNMVVLLSNDGTGFRTVGVYLPHQIYKEKLEILVKNGAKEFHIIPVNTKTIQKIAYTKWDTHT